MTPGHPYWWDAAPPQDISGDLPAEADLLVIGAGYTGLSAALAAANCGASVVVVDAGLPGAGASSLNGGMFGAHPRLGWDVLAAKFSPDIADAIFAEATPALEFVKDLIAREDIQCDLQQTGRIQLAWTASQFEGQKRLVDRITEKSDVEVRLIDRPGLSTEITTERYFGGILFPQHCAIHPAKFHTGLLAAVQRRGVPIIGNCPVTSLNGKTARTPQGQIRARQIILATNGYTTRSFPWQAARIFPLPSYLIATEALPANLIGHLAPGRRMMVETRARHSYYRISPDGTRILYGGRASMRDIDLGLAAKRLQATMAEVWPDLAKVRLSHVWTGNTGYSFTHMPTLGVQDGIHYAMGFSGSGTVLAPYLGAKAAWTALGDPRGETAYARTHLTPSWMHRFSRPHFLKPADLWYRHWVDRLESRQSR